VLLGEEKRRLFVAPGVTGNCVHFYIILRSPLWSGGQSSWLQIQRSGFDSRHYQEKKVVSLERGPLRMVSTTEELRDRKVAAPV
jgi:hypothetical protein